MLTRILGSDGGPVCEDPDGALNKALYLRHFSNGASQVGVRLVIADSDVVKQEELVFGICCPEKLPGFQDFVKDQKFDNVINQ